MVIPLTTGIAGVAVRRPPTSSRMADAIPSIRGEWKACETSSAVTWIPWAASCSEAAFTPAVLPEMTV